jgi:hypothetical protein
MEVSGQLHVSGVYPRRKSPWLSLYRKLNRPHKRCGRFGEKNRLPLPVIEIRFIGFSTHSLVVIQALLYHLHTQNKSKTFVKKKEVQKYLFCCFMDVSTDFAA